jgi:hypothetical protein
MKPSMTSNRCVESFRGYLAMKSGSWAMAVRRVILEMDAQLYFPFLR